MKDVAHVLKKQKQLLEIEIGELKTNKTFGYPGIHPEIYYAKVANAWKLVNEAIKILESTEGDIYNNYKFIEN